MQTILFFLIAILLVPTKLVAQPKHEIRATWVTTLGGMDWPKHKATNAHGIQRQQQELCTILDSLKKANFNTVMLQVRLRGDLIYPSSIETQVRIPVMTHWLLPSKNATKEAWNFMPG